MRRPVRRRGVALVLCLGLAVGLAGCDALDGSSSIDTEEERRAQDMLIGLLNTRAMKSYTDELEDFARAAAGHAGIDVVRVEEREWSEYADTFGWLTFSVSLGDPTDTRDSGWRPEARDLGPYCFRVPFDHYGKHGEFGTADGVRLVECPADAGPVELPPDEVVAAAGNAREAAHAVLDALPASGLPSEEEIADRIAALLDPPEADHITTAPPSVAVDGTDVGVAMGGVDDCVLVKRANGVVTDVYAPRVYLQPGELGCRPWTALAEDLRPPH